MRRQPILSTLSGRLLRIAAVLGVAVLAALVTTSASAHVGQRASHYTDVLDPEAAASPTTAQLAERLDREATRVDATLAAVAAAQQAAKNTADQARMLALGGLIVGVVGLIVAALAWGRQAAALDTHPDVALTSAGKG
jgi:mannose/fructose/N-acetylgalactosamine-specific phosphotransferase system component IID